MAPVNPLNINVPIVDPRKGTPTAQFMQTWAQQQRSNATIPADAASLSALLDLLGNDEGDMLRRGPDSWMAFTSPGGTTQFLRADGVWAVPAGGGGGTLASLTDVDIPSPNTGEVLTYDAVTTKWESKPVGGMQNPAASKWRAQLSATNNGNANTGFAIMEMHAVPGGPQLCITTTDLSVSATSFGSKDWLITGTAVTGQFWVTAAGVVAWIEYDFASPVSINEFSFVMAQDGAGSGPGCWPTDIDFQYWNGAAWVTAWSVHGQHPSPNTTTPVVYTDPAYTAGFTLAGLADVNIPSPADGQVLTFDSATSKWEAETPAAGGGLTVATQTASYTLILTDDGSYQRMSVATANHLVIPDNASVPLPIGALIRGIQAGAGQTDVGALSGVTLNYPTPPGSPYGQWDDFTLIKVDTDEWDVLGHANINTGPFSAKWRMNCTANSGDPNCGFNYLEMAESAGGTNIATVGANLSAQSTIFGSITNCAGPPGSVWVSNGPVVWVEYDFPTAVALHQFGMNVYVPAPAALPRDFTMEYWDGAAWQVAATFTGVTGVSGMVYVTW